jgi:hypothetical protein
MNRRGSDPDVIKSAEEMFVDAYANLSDCTCAEGLHLHMALSETRARPLVYAPDHIGIKNAYCATFGRRCSM